MSSSTLRVSGPADLISLVPYLLGFHPEESLVWVSLGRRGVEVTARVDLDAALAGVAGRGFAERLLRQFGDGEVLLVAYSADVALATAVLENLPAGLPRRLDCIVVWGDRWRSILCDDPDCCPPEGNPYDPTRSAAVAEAVVAGLSALPGRGALRDLIAGPPPDEIPDLIRDAQDARRGLRRWSLKRRMGECERLVLAGIGGGELSRADCLRLLALCQDIVVRDVAWLTMSRPRAQQHVDLWQRVVRHAPEAWAVPALCLLAMAAWISGNGALQLVCLERGEQIDPSYSMLAIIEDIAERAVPPWYWDLLRDDMAG